MQNLNDVRIAKALEWTGCLMGQPLFRKDCRALGGLGMQILAKKLSIS